MRAALLSVLGRPPAVGEAPTVAPERGEALLEVLAAPLNPIDIAIGGGQFYGGHPALPYVPGVEAVGRVVESGAQSVGAIVWAGLDGMGLRRDGSMADTVMASDSRLVSLPEGADPAVAAGLGAAGMAGWLPLAWRAPLRPGETVLVLGATGVTGMTAVQAARILGAGRIVAAGRNEERLRRTVDVGADATVQLAAGTDLAAAFRDACGGQGPDLIVDPLWGPPLAAALEAAAPRARIVHLGQSAGATATITSAAVRGKQLELLGFSDFAVPADVWAEHYRRLVSHAIAGRLRLEIERVPLKDITAAWRRQTAGPEVKLVVVP